ncbi:MAG: zinc-dependent metalloprotease [Bacteroidota bacterium]
MKNVVFWFFVFLFALGYAQTFEKTANFQKFNGYFNFYYDDDSDKVFLEVDKPEQEFLYVYALSSGVGSNDIGLDRGQLGNEQVVYFKKAGKKLLLVQPNMRFRAITENALEKASVEQAFAKSILFGFEIAEESKGKYLIDITDFLFRDAHGVSSRLKRTKQGTFSLDKSKSALAFERTKAFPKNIEFDVTLTFKGTPQGDYIRSVTPNPSLITVAQHHSFIALPDDGFEKREYDPRCGSYPFTYYDYATPVQEAILKRFIPRHRLEKKDPNAKISEAVEPLVYYLDNGTPEPVRSALLEGGQWWNQAFEAIGYKDAFQVKILPDDADPLDVRYNVIQWVHRSTRGWSYGSSVRDPRTGEIIKGHVSLGSLRIRQDFMIAQALMNRPFADRDDNYEPMLAMALARIRQLSAHEIGHTLGFAHNFAASTNNDASVMDYPHPQFKLVGNEVDFSTPYDTGIGEWDKVTVAYAYSDFPNGVDEKQALNAILRQAQEDGLRYISDQDARPMGGAHALGHLWDNGKSATQELERVLDIRKKAIENFSIDNIRSGEPYSVLEDVFVPLYFFHRYQLEGAVKLVGGLDYNYKVKDDGQFSVKTLNRVTQENALKMVIKTLEPEVLAIPEEKIDLFPPRSIGYPRTRESFQGKTGVAFDPLGAAETAAATALNLLLHPERANRLVSQKAIDEDQLGLAEVVDILLNRTVKGKKKKRYLGQIQKTVNWQVVQSLMHLASHKNSYPQVTETILFEMMRLKTYLGEGPNATDPTAILMKQEVEGFIKNPRGYKVKVEAPKIPDGSPIGMECMNYFSWK